MFILRNRFLNSTALLLDRPNEGGGGNNDDQSGQNPPTGQDENQDQGGGDDGQQDDNGTGDDAGDDDTGGADDTGASDGEPGDDDEDDELSDLDPAVRARVQKRLEKETAWRDRQIDRLYRKSREAQEDAAALETIAQRGAAAEVKTPSTPAEVQAAAQQLRAKERYDEGCNKADEGGRAAYGERWGKALARLPKMGGVDVNDMTNIIATDAPHVVLFELSKPDVYERVMALPAARRLNEFVKLSLKPAPKPASAQVESKRPSDAPAPVTPIQGGRRVAAKQVNLYDDKAADDAWYAARNATRRKKFSTAD